MQKYHAPAICKFPGGGFANCQSGLQKRRGFVRIFDWHRACGNCRKRLRRAREFDLAHYFFDEQFLDKIKNNA